MFFKKLQCLRNLLHGKQQQGSQISSPAVVSPKTTEERLAEMEKFCIELTQWLKDNHSGPQKPLVEYETITLQNTDIEKLAQEVERLEKQGFIIHGNETERDNFFESNKIIMQRPRLYKLE